MADILHFFTSRFDAELHRVLGVVLTNSFIHGEFADNFGSLNVESSRKQIAKCWPSSENSTKLCTKLGVLKNNKF